ncbi:L-carnitine dehydratase/bile acid-inducible protein F [plant metagenome]|uniref:L-carnitine dehydratase/bile acid-inducible protein F n=1 Tax=plant metagenome TaxID=1297885 RepID=A0A484Q4Z0_9ZZZZ
MKTLPPSGALAGLRVLEMGSTVAGPFCGRLLADFGAEVIKIEAPEGDPLRTMGEHQDGVSLYAASLLRNKSLVTLDLRQAEGQALARELALRSDIVIENFRPGTLEKWNMGYDVLSSGNPGVILVRISGYGQDGPYRDRPGYGVIGEAVSGVRHMTGDPDRPPARVAVSMTDYLTGLYGAFGAMMAVHARQATGKGQVVDAALYEGAFSMMEPFVPAYDKLGTVPARTGSRLPGSTPNNLYPSRDGGHVHIAAMSDAVFRRLAAAMEDAGLGEDGRYATAARRRANEETLDARITAWTSGRDQAAIEQALAAAGVPAARAYTLADIFDDPHYRARRMLQRVPHDELGDVTVAGVVPQLSGTPGCIKQAGGAAGRDTRDVLSRWLDLDAARLDALAQRGVLGHAEAGA